LCDDDDTLFVDMMMILLMMILMMMMTLRCLTAKKAFVVFAHWHLFYTIMPMLRIHCGLPYVYFVLLFVDYLMLLMMM